MRAKWRCARWSPVIAHSRHAVRRRTTLLALGSLAGYGADVRTPHNYAIYLIGYSGLIGLAIFVLFLVALVLSIVHLPPSLFRTFLLAEVGTVITIALFGNGLETPFIAVPFYLTTGLAFGVAKLQ